MLVSDFGKIIFSSNLKKEKLCSCFSSINFLLSHNQVAISIPWLVISLCSSMVQTLNHHLLANLNEHLLKIKSDHWPFPCLKWNLKVLLCGSYACTMLWDFCFYHKAETHTILEMVPWFLSMSKVAEVQEPSQLNQF